MNPIAPRRFKTGRLLLLVIIAIAAFLLLLPTRVQPVAWTPSPAPSLNSGTYADNQRLKGLEVVGAKDIDGPEALLLEDGQLLSGLHDGRVIQTSLDGKLLKVLVNTGATPISATPAAAGVTARMVRR